MDVQSELPKKSTGDSFKDLIIWRRAVEVSLVIYQLTSTFPRSEQFGLTNQLRRAGVSVASNIAEGYGRSSRGEYVVFLGWARGSNFEIQTQLIIAEGLNLGEIELLLRQKHFRKKSVACSWR
jgi:four helix bundle protein